MDSPHSALSRNKPTTPRAPANVGRRLSRGLTVALLCCLALAEMAVARSDAFLGLQRYALREGLPQMSVAAVAEGPDGLLWIGTQEGLARFDGQVFEVFRHQPGQPESLASSSVDALLLTGDDQLWIGTNDAGIEVRGLRDGGLWRFSVAEGLSHPTVGHLLLDGDGVLAGTVRGIDRAQIGRPRAQSLVASPEVVGLARFEGVAFGLDRSCQLWRLSEQHVRRLPSVFPANSTCQALAASEDGLWLASQNDGLFLTDAEGSVRGHWPASQLHPAAAQPSELLVQSDGTLLIGFESGELARLDSPSQPTPTRLELSLPVTSALITLFEHRSGTLWLGTRTAGLYRAGTLSAAVEAGYGGYAQASTWPARSVYAIHRQGTHYLVGTDRGLVSFDTQQRRWSAVPSIGARSVRRILPASEGGWWIGTMDGLWRLAEDGSATRIADHLDARISDLLWKDGRLWVSTRNGLYWHADGRSSQAGIPEALRQGFLTALLEDADGNLWIGSNEGGLHVLTADGGLRWLHRGNGRLAHDSVWALREHAGAIWVGTYGGGLQRVRLDDDHAFLLGERDGLSNNVVYRIEPDLGGRLWLSTNRGLNVFDPDTGRVQLLRESDGLTNTEYNAGASFRDADGLLHFGGTEGLDVLDPDALPQHSASATPLLSRLQTIGSGRKPSGASDDWAAISLQSPLRFGWRERVLSATLVALDFSAPDAARLRYRLRGLDDAWIEPAAPRSEVLFSALPAGDYQLEMQAAGRDGEFGPSQLIDLQIAPPPWFSPIALALYLLIALGLLLGLWLRQRAAERGKQLRLEQLNQQVAQRTAELQAANLRLERSNAALDLAGRTDPLTQVSNRRDLHEWLAEASPALLAQARAGGRRLLVCLLDLDDFKQINDRFGHPAGDQVLVALAARLRELCREGDLVVRWGGEEFLLMLRDARPDEARATLDRLLAQIALPISVEGVGRIAIGCSIGVAPWPFSTRHAQGNWEQSVGIADRALYRAKREGKAAWQIWSDGPELSAEGLEQLLEGAEPESLGPGAVHILRGRA